MTVYTVFSRSDKGTVFIGNYSSYFRAERQIQYMFESQGLYLKNKLFGKNMVGYDGGTIIYEIYENQIDD